MIDEFAEIGATLLCDIAGLLVLTAVAPYLLHFSGALLVLLLGAAVQVLITLLLGLY